MNERGTAFSDEEVAALRTGLPVPAAYRWGKVPWAEEASDLLWREVVRADDVWQREYIICLHKALKRYSRRKRSARGKRRTALAAWKRNQLTEDYCKHLPIAVTKKFDRDDVLHPLTQARVDAFMARGLDSRNWSDQRPIRSGPMDLAKRHTRIRTIRYWRLTGKAKKPVEVIHANYMAVGQCSLCNTWIHTHDLKPFRYNPEWGRSKDVMDIVEAVERKYMCTACLAPFEVLSDLEAARLLIKQMNVEIRNAKHHYKNDRRLTGLHS